MAAMVVLAGLPAVATGATGSSVSVGDVRVAEPAVRTGTVKVEVPITVHPAAATSLSLAWRTVAGTASAADFTTASGTLAVAAGAAGGAIEVQVRADKLIEGIEWFSIEVTSAPGAVLADASGDVTIAPSAAGLSLGDVTVTEPDGGSLQIAVPATLGSAAPKAVSIGWQLRSGTGTVGEDAPAASGTATIAKGSLGTLLRIAISGDTTVEPDEGLEVAVTSLTNTSLADGLGAITLRNSDIPPPDTFGWTPPADVLAGDTTILYVESQSGDYIGQGRTYRYTQATSRLTVSSTASRLEVSVRGDEWWQLIVAEPSSQTALTTGTWDTTTLNGTPGASFFGEGRGCTTLGKFIVDSVQYAASTLDQITLRWEQRCDALSGPVLRGYFRWARNDSTVPPPPGDPSGLAWSPPAGAVPESGNYLYLASPAGDYIGQGRTTLYTEPATTFGITADPNVQITTYDTTPGYHWMVWMAGRYNQARLAVGLYDGVQRYGFHNPAKGGLDVFGEGRGCNEVLGSFAVDQISWDDAGLVSISARFEQRCEGTGPALHGAVRWTRP
jgi:hypothetical protein